ncbi:MAG: glycosyltransferase family 2 protein [Pseudomonadota bacterium]|uniref:glycosyltransferase family 2 protein n=1 Tax=Roseovarius TaxID=74030 RepID=UPI0022A6A918|nr:glycosyltransferase [Roseovarius sp. EGI FJ00037]MCZ0811358.1 glycosyltransferase [Roseovarius sp. EGI FJ00037]
MSPSFQVTVLTYNRRDTLGENLPSYQSLVADVLHVIDNGSTDGTDLLLAKVGAGDGAMRITRNRINMGYSRSLVKAFFLCQEDYQLFLSDEDVPEAAFLEAYRRVVARFGPVGVIARANPYPRKWTIPELDRACIEHEDDEITVIRPGFYAAHLAGFQSIYLGGLCVAPEAVTNAHGVTLERGSYPQRFLAMDAAYTRGLVLMKSDGLGAFPKAHASARKEAMTPRLGDWGVAEYISTAHYLLDHYSMDGLSGPAAAALREMQLRFAYTRAAFYFVKAAGGGEENAFRFLRNVRETSGIFARPLFWSYFYEFFNAMASDEQKKVLRRVCWRLEEEMAQGPSRETSDFAHQHLGFGRGVIKRGDGA